MTLTHLAHFTARRRWWVIGAWIVLTVVGAALSGRVAWTQSSSVPGQPAYEASQRALHEYGTGARSPNVLVFKGAGDVKPAVAGALASMPGARAGAVHGTGSTRFVLVYPPGKASWDRLSDAARMQKA